MFEDFRVLIHNDNTADLTAALKHRFPQVAVQECNSYDGLPEAITDFKPDAVYTVRFAGTKGFPKDALLSEDGPRWIANGGAGTDHFGHWDTKRVTITNAAGVAADMMAEYIFGGFLHFTLNIPGFQADKVSKTWSARRVTPLRGKTLLIVGLGNTGRAVALRAKAFGMRVIGTRARAVEMEHLDEVHSADDLPNLLPKADFIAVCTPLIPQTKGLLGIAEFDAMKAGVILADVSRGTVVDQSALSRALSSGQVAAAVLDVFEQEPLPVSSPLWDQKNVIISPHCSSVYDGWEIASFDIFLDNLQRWFDGEELKNIVDPDRGY